jgi:hypothetical protein
MNRVILELFCSSMDEFSIFVSVNRMLRCFHPRLFRRLKRACGLILRAIYLLQSSIDRLSIVSPIREDFVVYRWLKSSDLSLAVLYESMVGSAIVWRDFSIVWDDLGYFRRDFVESREGLLFEIVLPAGAATVRVFLPMPMPVGVRPETETSATSWLIAASSAFFVQSVDHRPIGDFVGGCGLDRDLAVWRVRLEYFISWRDSDPAILPRGS